GWPAAAGAGACTTGPVRPDGLQSFRPLGRAARTRRQEPAAARLFPPAHYYSDSPTHGQPRVSWHTARASTAEPGPVGGKVQLAIIARNRFLEKTCYFSGLSVVS